MDIVFLSELVVFVILLAFSGFFSSTEVALFSLNQFQLDQMRRENNRRVDLIERLRSEPRRLIVTILIGNEFVNVAASTLSAVMVIHLWGADNQWINLLIMVPILLLFGEITPKVLAIRNNKAFATVESGLIEIVAQAITPLRWVIRHVSDFFITLIVGKERSKGNIVTEDMVRTLAREAVGEGTLDHQEAQFIDQIFEFGNKTLDDIKTPRADIEFLAADMPPRDIIAEIRRTRQSRYPIYRGHRDTVVGVLHARDLLGVDLAKLERDPQGIRKLLREANFFPESKPASELFHTFREHKLSFALTVDEYGGVTGLVTMEDLLECVFGDIRSPSDVSYRAYLQDLGEGRHQIDTAIAVKDFNAEFGTQFALEQVETLGGILLDAFGELPEEGASILLEDWRFTVQAVENNRITQVLMEPAPDRPEAPDGPFADAATAAEAPTATSTPIPEAETAAEPDNRPRHEEN